MNKKQKQDRETDAHAEDEMPMNIASATEVTGMVSTPPLTDDQAEGYRSLFDMPQKKAVSAQKADSPEEQEKNSRRR